MFSRRGHKVLEPAKADEAPLQSFSLPKKHAKMEDHIAKAQGSSDPFEYVCISGRTETTRMMLLRLVQASRSKPSTKLLELDDLPIRHLRERKITISIVDLLGSSYMKACKEYITLTEIIGHFTPTQSFWDAYSDVKFSIIDERKIENQEVRCVVGSCNVSLDIRMELDYSVHKSDFHHIKLQAHLQGSEFNTGVVWGSFKMFAKFLQSREALSLSMNETIAIVAMPESSLRPLKHHPHFRNITFDNEDFKELKSLHKKGKIISRAIPVSKQQKISYAASEANMSDQELIENQAFIEEGDDKSQKIKQYAEEQALLRANMMMESVKDDHSDAGAPIASGSKLANWSGEETGAVVNAFRDEMQKGEEPDDEIVAQVRSFYDKKGKGKAATEVPARPQRSALRNGLSWNKTIVNKSATIDPAA